MITQDQIRQAWRVVHEAERGTTQEKVNARRAGIDYLKTLLAALEGEALGVMVERINELERENARLRRKEETETAPPPMPRRQVRFDWSKPSEQDGKMAAAGKDT